MAKEQDKNTQTQERLGNLQILILDTNLRNGQLTRSVLSSLGITQNTLARDTEEAMHMLNERPFDLLLLEWDATPKNGIMFTEHIRRSPECMNRTIPIILASFRSDAGSMAAARDAGATEYLVKPFSSKTVLSRLNSIVDEPRHFVVVHSYVGPDRRLRSDGAVTQERRGKDSAVISREALAGLEADENPKIIVPDFSLKQKIEALSNKMAGIDAILPQAESKKLAQDYVQWMLADLAILRQSYRSIQHSSEFSATYIERIRASCTSIRSRAMSCGYVLAAKVAAQLHDFCHKFFNKDNRQHYVVIEKHIDTINAILSNRLSGEGGAIGSELFNELMQLVSKAIRIGQ